MLVADEVRVWALSFANCAIEGNRFAIYMTELWDRDKEQFAIELHKWLGSK